MNTAYQTRRGASRRGAHAASGTGLSVLFAGFPLRRLRLLLAGPHRAGPRERWREADKGKEHQDRKQGVETFPVQVHGRDKLRPVGDFSSQALFDPRFAQAGASWPQRPGARRHQPNDMLAGVAPNV